MSSNSYDLALIDVRLPDTDGIELLRKLISIDLKMKKIMITGFPSIDDGIKALEGGADAYLVKPVKPEELIKIIEDKLKNTEKTP